MKSSLLLIPLLFFMISCTIDGSNEKDKKITELENQTITLKQQNQKIEQDLSGTIGSLQDEQLKTDTELDAVTGDTLTQLKERLRSDATLEDGGQTYKDEVFDGKNTGVCYISNNFNRTNSEEAKQIVENCKPGNIILEKGENSISNCILSPDGSHYIVLDTLSNNLNWKQLGEYYILTKKYVIFFNKRAGEYCYNLIQTNPLSFSIQSFTDKNTGDPEYKFEYGTDGGKIYYDGKVFEDKNELQKYWKRSFDENNKRGEELEKQDNAK